MILSLPLSEEKVIYAVDNRKPSAARAGVQGAHFGASPQTILTTPAPRHKAMVGSAPDIERLSDTRSLRSQEALRKSLLQLLETQPLDQVSVRQIVSGAGVSYPTFYRHYETREELLADIARSEIAAFMSRPFASSRDQTGQSPGEAICAYIETRRARWSVLLAPGAAATMREAFIREGRRRAEVGPRFNPRFPAEVMSAVVASSMLEILAWWLHRAPDHPVGEVAAMLDWLVINPATRPAKP